MAVWFHVTTTAQDGTTWQTSQALGSWEAVVEFISEDKHEKYYGGTPAKVEIERFSDDN